MHENSASADAKISTSEKGSEMWGQNICNANVIVLPDPMRVFKGTNFISMVMAQDGEA